MVVGLLVLASQDPAGLAKTLTLAREQTRPIHDIEREQHGVSHAEIGAHLLARWGIPHTITEAVAGHHDSQWLRLPFDTVAAVQVANILVAEIEARTLHQQLPASELDPDFLDRAGLADRAWRALAARQFGQPQS